LKTYFLRCRAAWPLAAVCCLGLILFLICAAIVLALIPLYLPTKNLTPSVDDNKSTSPFYLQLSGDDETGSGMPGEVGNLDEIGKSLNLPSDVNLSAGSTSNSVSRRRRSFFGARTKRSVTIKILLVFNFIAQTCNTQCLLVRKKFKTDIQKVSSTNINLLILGGPLGNVTISGLTCKSNGIFTTKPSGFPGPPKSIVFTTTTSGDFTDATIWDQQVLPGGPCEVVIAAGTTVTLATPGLGIKAKMITIYGILIIGGGNSAFTFRNAINVKIRKGGILQDATTTKRILVPVNSLIYAFSGGSFGASGTTIQTYTSSGVGASTSITTTSGPLTCAFLPDGTVRTAAKIAFFAVKSGSFKTGSSFCGGVAPTSDDCSDSACSLEVLSGVTLSTADLNGVLDINFDTITINSGATMGLGTPGSASGFKFKFPVALSVLGALSFVASGGNILVPYGSQFVLQAGGSLQSLIGTLPSLQTYSLLTGILGSIQTLASSGPFFVVISVTGTISSGTDLSQINATTTTTATTPVATAAMSG
ncbi:unnamed protein product, partial [Adineta ricciae]